LIYRRCLAGVFEGMEVKVDIQRGPIQMKAVMEFDFQNIRNSRVLEPWELVVRKEILLPRSVKPTVAITRK